MGIAGVEDKKSKVAQAGFWCHTFDFGDGVVTPGVIPPKVQQIICSAIPDRLDGKEVLDIGAFDGYYAFECERRGAKVTAIDSLMHNTGNHAFETAKELLGSKVEFIEMDLFDLPKLDRKFDVVLCLGVLYHIKNPLAALEIMASKVTELAIVESHCIKTKQKEPLMRFYPGDELCGDPSNWWGPNPQCIIDMLRAAGFAKAALHTMYNESRDMGRAIVKAWK